MNRGSNGKREKRNNFNLSISLITDNLRQFHNNDSKKAEHTRFHVKSEIRICGNDKCKFITAVDKTKKKERKRLKICENCKSMYYCSRKCQKIDWKKRHRFHCTTLRSSMY